MDSIEELFQYFEDEILSPVVPSKSNKKKRKRSVKRMEEFVKRRNITRLNDQNEIRNRRDSITIDNIDLTQNCSPNKSVSLGERNHLNNPCISIHKITDIGCVHEVAYSSTEELKKLFPSQNSPAKTYKFELDPFQKQALLCIENNQSVLVSAHTSAGKTAIAEYAIARSMKNKQRVIYTTPIKALSNQKYRELLDEFKDVGLMTGDVTIEGSASCIVMTTEILRNMLYKGSEVMKEVGWVVFDEIHYMRDKVRGVVWEETLILLPKNVRYVFLSATIPNASQFAEWICHLHRQPCNVVYTEHRPTPLQHFIYPALGKKLQLVVNEKGNLNENNFNAAMAMLQPNDSFEKPKIVGNDRGPLFYLVTEIMERKWAPVIVFNFSKYDCERHALNISDSNFNTEDTSYRTFIDERERLSKLKNMTFIRNSNNIT